MHAKNPCIVYFHLKAYARWLCLIGLSLIYPYLISAKRWFCRGLLQPIRRLVHCLYHVSSQNHHVYVVFYLLYFFVLFLSTGNRSRPFQRYLQNKGFQFSLAMIIVYVSNKTK